MTQPHQSDTGATILNLGQHRSTRAFPQVGALETYWAGLRDGASLPMRRDVDPRAIQDLLEYAFIAEQIAPGMARLRIAGAHLSDLSGMEVRGMPLSGLLAVEARQELKTAITALFDQPAKIDLHLRGGKGIEGRLVMLPLLCEDGRVSRALGCLITQGTPTRLPCRMDIASSQITPIAQSKRPYLRPVTTVKDQTQKRPPNGERPYLRLVTQTD